MYPAVDGAPRTGSILCTRQLRLRRDEGCCSRTGKATTVLQDHEARARDGSRKGR
jgi:hypothetical protein